MLLSKLLFIFLAAFLVSGCSPNIKQEEADTAQETIKVVAPTPTPTNTNAYIQASDQKPGKTINIGTVSAQGKNFIVVYKGSEDDTHAEMIGKSQPITGSQNDFNIVLDKPAVVGDQISAVLYGDNGDSLFSESEDVMILDESGSAVQANFIITAN